MRPATLDAVTLEKLISAAVAAPSIHNTQPWRYRLDPDTSTLEVRAAPERGLRHIDPLGRALHVSVGAALFNLRVAVAHFGWEPVLRLLPHPGEPDLLASVRLAGPAGTCRHRPDLYDVLWRRHTSRFPLSGRRLPAALLAELTEAAQAEGTSLSLPDPEETRRLLRVTAAAERRNADDPDRRAETRGWIREGASDGLTASAVGPQDATGRLPVRDFSGLRPAEGLPMATFESRPLIAVLTTVHDRRADWLRAGQALEQVLLVATAHSARASLLHQALEWPDLRGALNDARSGPAHVQMLIRLGYGPAGPATPRRPARELRED
jgi:nitroreductase